MVVHTFPRGDDEPARLGLSVSRKVGGAVERNRVKRLIREAFASHSGSLQHGFDIVVVARPDLGGGEGEGPGLEAVGSMLGELLSEAGVISESAADDDVAARSESAP